MRDRLARPTRALAVRSASKSSAVARAGLLSPRPRRAAVVHVQLVLVVLLELDDARVDARLGLRHGGRAAVVPGGGARRGARRRAIVVLDEDRRRARTGRAASPATLPKRGVSGAPRARRRVVVVADVVVGDVVVADVVVADVVVA